MLSNERSTDKVNRPGTKRRRLLRWGGAVLGATITTGQVLPFVLWPNNRARIGGEHDKTDARRLALIASGIGRDGEEGDLARTLRPGLTNKDTTVASLIYGNRGMNVGQTAEAIIGSGHKDLVLVGHSIGGGHFVEVVERLRPQIESSQIKPPRLVLLSSPFSRRDLVSPLAVPMSYAPLGLLTEGIADAVAFGGFNDVSPRLEMSQLDRARDFDGTTVALGAAELIHSVLYIGDSSPDGVINTPQAAADYQQAFGDKLTIRLVAGLAHPDPAQNSFQADTYNREISAFLAAA